MLVNYGGPVRWSRMIGTMNALSIKIFLSGAAAGGHAIFVRSRGFSHNILKIYVEYFSNNSKVLCNETRITKVHSEHVL